MDSFANMINSLLRFLIELGDIVVAAIVTVESWLRGQLEQLGLPPAVQTVLLVALAIVLIVGSVRLFSGLIRMAVVLVLIVVALHIVMPVMHR